MSMQPEIPASHGPRPLSRSIALAVALVACLALQACLKKGPGEAELVAILMEVQSERPAGPPEAIEVQAHECRLMNHGQAYECNVEFVQTRGGTYGLPRKAYLIVSETDEGWRLISHEPKS